MFGNHALNFASRRNLTELFSSVLPLSMVDNSALSPNRLTIPIDPAYPS
jgi:hypothetical protein